MKVKAKLPNIRLIPSGTETIMGGNSSVTISSGGSGSSNNSEDKLANKDPYQ